MDVVTSDPYNFTYNIGMFPAIKEKEDRDENKVGDGWLSTKLGKVL